ncbi:MAG: anthranilate synthase component I [Actinobacteria bacterium]|nr:anthranilate synthase component I [Actinomycetota bacterium]
MKNKDGVYGTGRDTAESGRLDPDRSGFTGLSGNYEKAFVFSESSCDLETPISAFIKLKGSSPCFLLESAEKGKAWGRYSILGFDPEKIATGNKGVLTVSGTGEKRELPGDPVAMLFEEVERERVFTSRKDIPFSGGAVGYFGYEILPYLEKVDVSENPCRIPEMMFMFPRRIAVFDHLRSRILLGVLTGVPSEKSECREAFDAAVDKLNEMTEALEAPLPFGLGDKSNREDVDDFEGVNSNMPRDEYEGIVERAREYILEGEAFQIVLSQNFTVPFDGEPLSIYRQLRSENPSPYMFYLDLPEVKLVGSSPEPMVTQREGTAMIRPIAGTRKRGGNGEEDAACEADLLSDPKEKAEHIMLVDLARNDLGRVCEAGTISVSRLMEVERYSHVMHLVSEVDGKLRDGKGNHELLKASFPAGTVSGAPKVRACQIIEELESDGRGPYAGAVGYLSYTGDMDVCITIRTVVVIGNEAMVQAGAGIVADSVPANEYEETRNKARALIRAVKAAR